MLNLFKHFYFLEIFIINLKMFELPYHNFVIHDTLNLNILKSILMLHEDQKFYCNVS